jgi:hypothetical protein
MLFHAELLVFCPLSNPTESINHQPLCHPPTEPPFCRPHRRTLVQSRQSHQLCPRLRPSQAFFLQFHQQSCTTGRRPQQLPHRLRPSNIRYSHSCHFQQMPRATIVNVKKLYPPKLPPINPAQPPPTNPPSTLPVPPPNL